MVRWVEKREEAQERRGGRAMERSKEEKGEKKRDREEGGGRHTTPSRAGGQECPGPKCGPHRFPDSLPAGSRPNGAWAGSLEAVPSRSSFLSSQGFQQTLRNLGSVGQETLRALG